MSLNPLSRRRTLWLYAKNGDSDSVGDYCGILYPARLGGSIHCWKAKGEAYRLFNDSIKAPVLDFLTKNSDKVRESGHFLSVTLFMVGKKAQKSKPYVLLISDDKASRKQAFNMLKESQILASYPDFELGDTDFRAMMALAGAGITVSGVVRLTADGNTEILELVCKPDGSLDEPNKAMAGGLVVHCDRYMVLSANHFLEHSSPEPSQPSFSNSEVEDRECEFTGLSDFDDDSNDEDEDVQMTDLTSQYSMSGHESSMSGSDSDLSAESSDTKAMSTLPFPTGLSLDRQQPVKATVGGNGDFQGTIGEPVVRCRALDYTLIEIDPKLLSYVLPRLPQEAIHFDNDTFIEQQAQEVDVSTTTTRCGKMTGRLSGQSHHIRLPHSKEFTEVYVVQFSQPLVPGDCGSWIRDVNTGSLYGHIVAGNAHGEAIVIPARAVFKHARSLNKGDTRLPIPRNPLDRLQTKMINEVLELNIPEVKSALQAGASPNITIDSRGTTALEYAAFQGDIELLEILKEAGAAVYSGRETTHSILFQAICDERRLLCTRPTAFSTDGWRRYGFVTKDARVLAAIKTIFREPSLWMDLLESLDTPDGDGVTPLMTATQQGLVETLSYLLKRGADTERENMLGWKADQFANGDHRESTLDLLSHARRNKAPYTNPHSKQSNIVPQAAPNTQPNEFTEELATIKETRTTASSDRGISWADWDAPGQLWCELRRLGGCNETFALNDCEGWVTHHIHHFHLADFPDVLSCWFCNALFVAGSDGNGISSTRCLANFRYRMKHIQRHIADAYIFDHRSIKDQARPDPKITNHLIKNGLLTHGNPWDTPENTNDIGAPAPTITTSPVSERISSNKNIDNSYVPGRDHMGHSKANLTALSEKSTIESSKTSVFGESTSRASRRSSMSSEVSSVAPLPNDLSLSSSSSSQQEIKASDNVTKPSQDPGDESDANNSQSSSGSRKSHISRTSYIEPLGEPAPRPPPQQIPQSPRGASSHSHSLQPMSTSRTGIPSVQGQSTGYRGGGMSGSGWSSSSWSSGNSGGSSSSSSRSSGNSGGSSSSSSRSSGYLDSYRPGNSSNYYVSVKDKPHHYRTNPGTDEPRSSDYYYSRGSDRR
ncbi:hypothetical protein V8F06_014317 [Rhypophila decipiens]